MSKTAEIYDTLRGKVVPGNYDMTKTENYHESWVREISSAKKQRGQVTLEWYLTNAKHIYLFVFCNTFLISPSDALLLTPRTS